MRLGAYNVTRTQVKHRLVWGRVGENASFPGGSLKVSYAEVPVALAGYWVPVWNTRGHMQVSIGEKRGLSTPPKEPNMVEKGHKVGSLWSVER